MSIQKPAPSEDEYIAKQEAVERRRSALHKSQQMEAVEREEQRQLHYMKCPKCGFDLETQIFRGVALDKCHHCNGTWLDAGELETLAGHGGDLLHRIADIFRRG